MPVCVLVCVHVCLRVCVLACCCPQHRLRTLSVCMLLPPCGGGCSIAARCSVTSTRRPCGHARRCKRFSSSRPKCAYDVMHMCSTPLGNSCFTGRRQSSLSTVASSLIAIRYPDAWAHAYSTPTFSGPCTLAYLPNPTTCTPVSCTPGPLRRRLRYHVERDVRHLQDNGIDVSGVGAV